MSQRTVTLVLVKDFITSKVNDRIGEQRKALNRKFLVKYSIFGTSNNCANVIERSVESIVTRAPTHQMEFGV